MSPAPGAVVRSFPVRRGTWDTRISTVPSIRVLSTENATAHRPAAGAPAFASPRLGTQADASSRLMIRLTASIGHHPTRTVSAPMVEGMVKEAGLRGPAFATVPQAPRFLQADSSKLALDHRVRGALRGDRICVPMHDPPRAVFRAENRGHAQRACRTLLTAHRRLKLLDFDEVREAGRDTGCEGVEAGGPHRPCSSRLRSMASLTRCQPIATGPNGLPSVTSSRWE
jgi:hypothetical protein